MRVAIHIFILIGFIHNSFCTSYKYAISSNIISPTASLKELLQVAEDLQLLVSMGEGGRLRRSRFGVLFGRLLDEGTKKDFVHLINSDNYVTKILGLMCMSQRYGNAVVPYIKTLLTVSTKLKMISGCIQREVQVNEMALKILYGYTIIRTPMKRINIISDDDLLKLQFQVLQNYFDNNFEQTLLDLSFGLQDLETRLLEYNKLNELLGDIKSYKVRKILKRWRNKYNHTPSQNVAIKAFLTRSIDALKDRSSNDVYNRK